MMRHLESLLCKIGDFDLLALLGVVFVFWQYRESFFQRQRQIILVLKSKLDISESWFGGNGYVGEPSDKQKLMFSNPFRIVHEIENSVVDELQLQTGIVDFSEDFNRHLASYNQSIRTVHGLVGFRKMLVSNNFEDAITISGAIKKTECDNEGYGCFLKIINDEKRDSVKKLCENLYQLDKKVHFDYIGSKEGGLNSAFYKLKDDLSEQVKSILKKLVFFDVIFFFALFILLIALVSFLDFNLSLDRIIIAFLASSVVAICLHEQERRSWLSIIK